jgi:nucleotide-binding universal stress UspA family protein
VTIQVLVPLDGSPLAEQALACAMMLGLGLPAELVLFRAVSIPPDTREVLDDAGLKAAALMEQLEAEANDYLRKVAGQLQGVGLSVRQVVRRGPAAEALLDYAEQQDIQQIVMTTHGYTGISRWTHGSVAERVLQSARVPVFLMRAQEGELGVSREPMSCQRILVPLDGSTVAEQVLPSAVSVAQAFGAEMILFQVPIAYVSGSLMGEWYLPFRGVLEIAEQDAQAYLDRVAGRLKEQGVNVSTAMQIGAVAESIIGYAEANRMDLIAMCTHGRRGLGRWTMGSVADRVLRASSTPILLVRAR